MSVILLTVLFCFNIGAVKDRKTAELDVLSGEENYLYVNGDEYKFSGRNIREATYYFLPSFVDFDTIIQSSDTIKIYDSDLKLLTTPKYNEVQDIYVDYGDGDLIPWKMCFCRSANLYTLFIELDEKEKKDIAPGAYIGASVKSVGKTGGLDFYSEGASIKGRGNTTWTPWAKIPFEIKLGSPASMCGLSPVRKYTFLANYFDGSLMLNKLAFDTASGLGLEGTSDSDWLDVYINGVYEGNYLICKEPDIGTNNVDIGNTEVINKSYIDHSEERQSGQTKAWSYGTYEKNIGKDCSYLLKKENAEVILKVGSWFSVGDLKVGIKSPRYASMGQVDYIRSRFENVDDKIRSGEPVYDYLDAESFAKYYIVEEFFMDTDAFLRSCYLYKKKGDEKIYAGPCWDFDNSAGQEKGEDMAYADYDESVLNYGKDYGIQEWPEDEYLRWVGILYDRDPAFRETVKEIFADNLNLMEDIVYKEIPEYYARISSSVYMDNIIWDDTTKSYTEYYNNVRYIQFFLFHRLMYMSELLGVEKKQKEPEDIKNGSDHRVTFITDNGKEESISVEDGSQLKKEDMPPYDDRFYKWNNVGHHSTEYSYYLPIFEDTVFELKPK